MTEAAKEATKSDGNTPAEPVKAAGDSTIVIESTILAYQKLQDVAARIADSIAKDIGKGPIVICHDKPGIATSAYKTAVAQLRELETAYRHTAVKPVTKAVTAETVSTVIKAVSDLVALFRIDKSTTSVPIPANDLPLASEVARWLATNGRAVYLSELFLPPLDSSDITKSFEAVQTAAAEASQRVSAIPQGDEKVAAQARLKHLDDVRVAFEKLLMQIAADGTSFLAFLMAGEAMAKLLSSETVHVLYLKVLHIVGSTEMTKTWTTAMQYGGGVVVNYIVFRPDGSIVKSGTMTGYSGLQKLGAH